MSSEKSDNWVDCSEGSRITWQKKINKRGEEDETLGNVGSQRVRPERSPVADRKLLIRLMDGVCGEVPIKRTFNVKESGRHEVHGI